MNIWKISQLSDCHLISIENGFEIVYELFMIILS